MQLLQRLWLHKLELLWQWKSKSQSESSSISATISALLGITEPAIFGVNLRYVKPFVITLGQVQ